MKKNFKKIFSQTIHSQCSQSGFSLLEVLISVVVLSIGLLGIAGLQTTSMKYTHDSHLRSIAITQVHNMADRMRANQLAVSAGAYNNLSGIPADPNCSSCTPTQRAQEDLYEWNTQNATLLPAGQGTVIANGALHTITVRWDNERTGATGLNCSGNTAIDLSCLTINIRV